MADNSNKTTTCEMIPGDTTKVTWKLKNWKEYSKSLVQRTSCLVELEGVDGQGSSKTLLRFTLKEMKDPVKAYDLNEGYERTKINIFYALNMEILDDFLQKPVSFKVRAMDAPNKLDTKEKTVTFQENVNEMIVDPYFIYKQRLVIGSRGLQNADDVQSYDVFLDKDTQELNIEINVTILTLKQEGGKSSVVGDPALVASRQQSLDEFAIFLEDNHFWDVKFKMSDDVLLPAHRIILSSRSSVFKAMLTSDMKDSKERIIEIPDIGSEAMKIILRHIYTGKVEVNMEGDTDGVLMKQVVYGASKYNLPQLLQHCDKVLIKVVNFGNAWELLKLTKMHNMPRATEDLEKFVKKNCLEVLQQIVGSNQS